MNQVLDHLDNVVVTEAFEKLRPSPHMSYSDRSMRSGAHIPFEKDASRESATVPVVSSGSKGDGDHTNVTVRCISLSFIIVFKREMGEIEGKGWRKALVGGV